ncbi:Solute carrier family 12 member 6 [Halotydeus destructor]|nr:Solute carrier family 12 member 6 [Halotydeus destructor]
MSTNQSGQSTVDSEKNLFLYSQEECERPAASSVLKGLGQSEDGPPKGAELGTLAGVYLPCIQNIFGVILFIRMVWIVGTAGVPLAFLVVLICCMVTFATTISLSAIATNGIVPAGGSYFMISRALGPEFGGAVGILFFLATGIAGAMYITGAVEIVLNYIQPEFALFGDFRKDPNILYHNIRVYGTAILFFCGIIVFIGVKFVSKVAPVALVCVLLSILSIYGGIFINYEGTPDTFCTLGNRIMASPVEHCTKNETDPESLFNSFCSATNGSGNFATNGRQYVCDAFYLANTPLVRRAVPGIASGVLAENMEPQFREKGNVISYDDGDYDGPKYSNILVDITSSFTFFVAIYFPSCTGILAGSNRSGDLKDGQRSIPTGTLAAQLTTSFVYLSSVVLFGAAFNNLFIRDKFGECAGGQLAVTLIAWPYPFLIVVGSLLSTMGAALQSLTSAPRLLQAIAADELIPFLNCFSKIDSRGEPVRALLMTLGIAEVAVLIGNLDFIAPILTMFFLMCYMFVNLACTLQSLLKTPNWRPRFKFYHWSFSLVGVLLCLFVMFISSWYYAIMAMVIAGVIYKYIEYRGAEKEWGDGFRGLALSAARFALLRLEEGPPHTKNWRPQVLVFVSLNEQLEVNLADRKLITFASQLKAGKGLSMVGSILEGSWRQRYNEVAPARQALRKLMNQERVKGFPDVLVSPSLSDGLCYFSQVSGLGGMKPNTVVMGWPKRWRATDSGEKKMKFFLDTLRNITASRQHALLVPKNFESWPDSTDKLGGTIDIWWIVHDGGLLMLIPFLLRQHRTWKNSKLRIFTVAQIDDNSIQMKKDLATWIYALRIEAEVEVVEMQDSDISAYTYERTLRMEQRSEILKQLGKEVPAGPAAAGSELARYGRRESKTALAIEQLIKETKGARELRDKVEKEQKASVRFTVIPSRKQSSSSSDIPEVVTTPPKESPEGSRTALVAASSGSPPSNELVAIGNVQEPTPQSTPSKENHSVAAGFGASLLALKPDEANVRRMHTAVKLNEAIVNKSHGAKLVVLNLPGLPKVMSSTGEHHYMEFLEVLTEGLDRVLLVRGGGREVITIYS